MKVLSAFLSSLLATAGFETPKERYIPPWQTLPSTPHLPTPIYNGTAAINGIDLWYGVFGRPVDQRKDNVPIVFLHGGFANSDYWALQIKYLENSSRSLIAIDTRAHGRSSDDPSRPLTYDAIARDVITLLDTLHVQKFAVVGWSDGAITGLNLAMNTTGRVDRLFAFGGSYSPRNVNSTVADTPTFGNYLKRAQDEYKRLSPTPEDYDKFESRLDKMWETEPAWRAESFQKIPTLFDDKQAPLIWLVYGDSEEAVTRDVPRTIFNWIWGSSLLMLPGTSHFAFMQDPETFNIMLKRFLAAPKHQKVEGSNEL